MRTIISIIALFVTSVSVFSQPHEWRKFECTDPYVGMWEIDDSYSETGEPVLTILELEWIMVDLSCGVEGESMISMGMFEEGFMSADFFQSTTNGKTIKGEMTVTRDELKGRTFQLDFRYDKENDVLYLIYKGIEYPYHRAENNIPEESNEEEVDPEDD